MSRVRRVVTSRGGGVSAPPYDSLNLSLWVGDDPTAVTANRQRLALATGVASDRFVWAGAVHGADVAVVTEDTERGRADEVPGVDALVTTTPGLALGIFAADCVTVLAADDRHTVAGAAHAGWRGAAGGVVDSLLAAMAEVGSDPADTDILLGPAICGRCYEVGQETYDRVVSALPASASRTPSGTLALDLRKGLAEHLVAAGVRAVTVDPRCTREDPDLFSYRRDGGVTGRHIGLVWVA